MKTAEPITGETSTDDEIRELQRECWKDSLGSRPGQGTVNDLCIVALGRGRDGVYPHSALARCAEIINARNAAKDGAK